VHEKGHGRLLLGAGTEVSAPSPEKVGDDFPVNLGLGEKNAVVSSVGCRRPQRKEISDSGKKGGRKDTTRSSVAAVR